MRALLSVLALAAAPAVALTKTTVMTNLLNPRKLAWGPDGSLYVAEAGSGGSEDCFLVRPDHTTCYGATGAISKLTKQGKQSRIVTGLPSTSGGPAATPEVIGPADISFNGGEMFAVIGWVGNATTRVNHNAAGTKFATLVRIQGNDWKKTAPIDLAAYEIAHNPGGGPLETNPYAVLSLPGYNVVVDTGANALLRVNANKKISTIATFPSRAQGRETDSAPTSVVRIPGRELAFYVSELAPFSLDAARVYKVVPGKKEGDAATVTVAYSGFRPIVDLAIASDGTLYVLEMFDSFFQGKGSVKKVTPTGTTVVVDGLEAPTGILFDPKNPKVFYLSIHGGLTTTPGEVVKYTLN